MGLEPDERRRRDREAKQGYYGRLTPEQRQARAARKKASREARRAAESPEQCEARRAKYREKSQQWRKANRDRYNAKRREYQARRTLETKTRIFEELGGRCCQCSFTDWRALQVDHVNGGGRAHRQRNGWSYWASILRAVLAGTGEYQLLCANCHMIKSYASVSVLQGRSLTL